MALAQITSSDLKLRAAKIRAERKAKSDDEAESLEGQAELAEIESGVPFTAKNIAAAQSELEFINNAIERLQPLRKYAHLSDDEAHQAAQHDEWKYELMHRAENQLLTTGTVAADDFSTMRMHPEFKTAILPHIDNTKQLMGQGLDAVRIVDQLKLSYSSVDVVALLSHDRDSAENITQNQGVTTSVDLTTK